MRAITFRNTFLVLFLFLGLTLILAVLYTFYPVMLASLDLVWNVIVSSGSQTGGIGAVAFGVSQSFLKVLLIFASVSFAAKSRVAECFGFAVLASRMGLALP